MSHFHFEVGSGCSYCLETHGNVVVVREFELVVGQEGVSSFDMVVVVGLDMQISGSEIGVHLLPQIVAHYICFRDQE